MDNCQNIFIRDFFANLDKDKVLYDESYWQSIFYMDPASYKKTKICMNGEQIGLSYLQNTYVSIGVGEDGTNTFSVGTGKLNFEDENFVINPDNILYQDSDFVSGVNLPLREYIENCEVLANTGTLEISEFLTQDYLNKLIAGNDLSSSIHPSYDNFTYDKEKNIVNIHAKYYVVMSVDGKRVSLNDVYLNINSDSVWITYGNAARNVGEFINDNNSSTTIYLETVLDYYGILSESKQEYDLSEDEIFELFIKYYQEVYTNSLDENVNVK